MNDFKYKSLEETQEFIFFLRENALQRLRHEIPADDDDYYLNNFYQVKVCTLFGS